MQIDSNTQFFIVEQNQLNNNHMVHSKCDQLPQCFAYKYKKDAVEHRDELNKKAFQEFTDKGMKSEQLTWKV